MPEVILNCPQCQRQLRVTEDLLGRPVRCPACGLTFTVPAGGGQAQPVVPPPMTPEAPRPRRRPPEDEYAEEEPRPRRRPREEEYEEEEEDYEERWPRRRPRPWDYEEGDRERAKSSVMAPASCLLIANAIGLLANGVRMVSALVIKHEPPPPDAPELLKKLYEMTPSPAVDIGLGAVFAVISVLALVGAIQMLRRRTYGLAMAGSILSMINFGCGCCILGLPFGIWAVVMLQKPEVKASFQ